MNACYEGGGGVVVTVYVQILHYTNNKGRQIKEKIGRQKDIQIDRNICRQIERYVDLDRWKSC